MADFFISYTHTDQAWAEWIAWKLEEAGYTTRLQAWDFRPGNNFVIEMQKGASESDRTLVVLSPDYLRSGFGASEWAAAFAQDPTGEKGKVLPVRVRRVTPDGLLRSIIYIDLVDLDEPAARERLMAGLAHGRAKPAAPPPFPGSTPPRFPGEPLVPANSGEAAARLDELPLEEIPTPGSLPPGSRMPLATNPLFVGRQEDLRALAQALKVGETAAIGQIAAATGLGGIGKTQLASEFAHRYGRFFAGGVFWMSFADPAAVPVEVAACGQRLGLLANYQFLPIDQQLRLVEEAWQSSLPRLLIFDNCEEPELLDHWRPRFGGARVLVTSRRSRWDPSLGVRTLPLGTLERPVSIELLRRFRPDVPEEDVILGEIAAELGDLPLALHLAGSFLARYQEATFGNPPAYLEDLRRGDLLSHPSLKGWGTEISPTGHEAHVARTFALSYERLSREDPVDKLAQDLLARAACFAAGEPIPRSLLLQTLRLDVTDRDSAFAAEDALERLFGLGLLESGGEGRVSLHRLVAAFVLEMETGGDAQAAVEETVAEEGDRLNKAGDLTPLPSWQAHLRFVTEAAREREDARAAKLCNILGHSLWLAGNFDGARPYFEQALLVRERVLGPGHSSTAESLNDLGVIFLESKIYSKAEEYLRKSLAIREKVLGAEHPDTAISLGNLGTLLSEVGDFANAKVCHERALEIREKTLGSEHPHTGNSSGNLGRVLQNLGDFSGAQLYLERALEIHERVLGQDHRFTTASLLNLGRLFWRRGNLAKARRLVEQVVSTRERTLGDHPDTAASLEALGIVFWEQKNLPYARKSFERCLMIRAKLLGREHPDTKNAQRHLQSISRGSTSRKSREL